MRNKTEKAKKNVPWHKKIVMKLQAKNFSQADELFVISSLTNIQRELESNVFRKMMAEKIQNKLDTESSRTDVELVDIVTVFVNEAFQNFWKSHNCNPSPANPNLQARILLKADRSSVFLTIANSGDIQTVSDDGDGENRVLIRLPIGKGIAGGCVKTGEVVSDRSLALNLTPILPLKLTLTQTLTWEVVLIEDAYSDKRFDKAHDMATGYKTKNILCVPITGSQGDVLGAVQMINKEGGFSQADALTLTGLVDKATMAIEKARLFDDVRMMMDANMVMNSELDLETLVGQVMQQARKILKADRCSLFLLDKNKNELWSTVADGVKEIRFSASSGIAGEVVSSKKPQNIADAYDHPSFNRDTDKETGYRTKSVLAMPVCGSDGEVIAVIQMVNKMNVNEEDEIIAFTDADQSIMGTFVVQATILFLSGINPPTTLIITLPFLVFRQPSHSRIPRCLEVSFQVLPLSPRW